MTAYQIAPDRGMKIGIVSLQGDFEKHGSILASLGVDHVYVRRESELHEVDALIFPGGESTTMLRLLDSERLFEPLVDFAQAKPLLGTCAGCILMAREVVSPAQRSMGVLDISVERNAYGRQLHSSIQRLTPSSDFIKRSEPGDLEAVFIRAPMIRQVGECVRVLAEHESGPVMVEQGPHLATTFHPELAGENRIHRFFVGKVVDHLNKAK